MDKEHTLKSRHISAANKLLEREERVLLIPNKDGIRVVRVTQDTILPK